MEQIVKKRIVRKWINWRRTVRKWIVRESSIRKWIIGEMCLCIGRKRTVEKNCGKYDKTGGKFRKIKLSSKKKEMYSKEKNCPKKKGIHHKIKRYFQNNKRIAERIQKHVEKGKIKWWKEKRYFGKWVANGMKTKEISFQK